MALGGTEGSVSEKHSVHCACCPSSARMVPTVVTLIFLWPLDGAGGKGDKVKGAAFSEITLKLSRVTPSAPGHSHHLWEAISVSAPSKSLAVLPWVGPLLAQLEVSRGYVSAHTHNSASSEPSPLRNSPVLPTPQSFGWKVLVPLSLRFNPHPTSPHALYCSFTELG